MHRQQQRQYSNQQYLQFTSIGITDTILNRAFVFLVYQRQYTHFTEMTFTIQTTPLHNTLNCHSLISLCSYEITYLNNVLSYHVFNLTWNLFPEKWLNNATHVNLRTSQICSFFWLLCWRFKHTWIWLVHSGLLFHNLHYAKFRFSQSHGRCMQFYYAQIW